MEERFIKWLDINEMRILKHIIIISDRSNGEAELGSIIYTRPLTESYNFKKQQEENEKEKATDSLNRLFEEYPKQKNYPNDRIDEIIFDSIKRTFPKSALRNDSILFNFDLEKIEIMKNRMVIPSTIYFSPEFSNVVNFYDYVGKTFKAPKIDTKIYTYYKPEFLDAQNFYATYDVSEEDVLEHLKIVKFE